MYDIPTLNFMQRTKVLYLINIIYLLHTNLKKLFLYMLSKNII